MLDTGSIKSVCILSSIKQPLSFQLLNTPYTHRIINEKGVPLNTISLNIAKFQGHVKPNRSHLTTYKKHIFSLQKPLTLKTPRWYFPKLNN